jgi:nucleoside-diphosphate-sugar epimerase
MKIVLTGASGLTGSALLPVLVGDHEVYAIHRPRSEVSSTEGVTWIEQDMSRPLEGHLPASVDAVIHLAQSRRYREFPGGAVDMFEVNSATTVRLLQYCCEAGGTRFVYASSGAIYPPGPRPVRENDTPKPGNFYGMSKLIGEQVVDQFRDVLTVATLRFFFIYGPGQRDMLIPGLATNVLRGEPIPLAGAQGIRINPIYVDDAAAAVAGALTLEQSGLFNVAGQEVVSIGSIATMLAAEVGLTPSFTHGPVQSDLIADIQRMREHLAEPAVGIHDGLRRFLAAGVSS